MIVPDRLSMSVEKTILDQLNLTSSFNIEIVTFTRLAEKMLKGKIKRCLTPEGSVMMLQRVIDQNADNLIYYRKSAKKQGFAREFYAVLTSLRNSGITPQQLTLSLEKLPKQIRGKIQDTAFLCQAYLEELSKNFSDSSTRLEALASELEKIKIFPKHIYITDFFDYKAPELKILEQLNRCALSLSVGIVTGKANQNARIYPHYTLQKLKEVAKNGGALEEVHAPSVLPKPLQALSSWLYSYEPTKKVWTEGKILLSKSPHPIDEIENVALQIKKAVVNEKLRYRDFGIAVPDVAEYAPFVKSVFKRFDIPFFIDKQEMLVDQAKPRFLLSALNVIATRFSLASVLEFVKNPLFELDAYDFENYVLAFGIDHTRFLSPFTLKSTAFGVDEKRKDLEKENAEKVRQKLCEMLQDFKSAESFTAVEYVKLLQSLEEMCQSAWKTYRKKLSAQSSFYDKLLEQVDKKLDSVYDELREVFEDISFTVGDFYNTFKSTLSTLKIALLPLYIDSVFVGDLSDSRYNDVEVLFVAGAVEGKVPMLSSGGIMLTDRDEQALKNQDIEVTPSTRNKNLLSMFEVVELLKMPKQRLCVSYSDTGADGKSQRPSSLVIQLGDLLTQDVEKTKPIEIENTSDREFKLLFDLHNPLRAQEFGYRLSSRKNCFLGVLDKAVATSLDAMFMQPFDAAYEFLTDEQKGIIASLYNVTERVPGELFEKQYNAGTTSVSKLENYFNCPHMHFFQYGLELKVKEEAKLLNNEQGIIIHAVLEEFFKIQNVQNEKLESVVECIFDEVISTDRFRSLAESSDSKGILRRLKSECVKFCTELNVMSENSLFSPFLIEAKFSENWSKNIDAKNLSSYAVLKPLAFDVDGKNVTLSGKIDRVDRWQDYVAIIDYKSYKDPKLDVKSIYHGVKIQLYLYLLALQENIDVKPAGVFYLPIFPSFIKDDGKNRYEFKGQVLKDNDVLEALDKTFFENPESTHLPAKFAKGKVSGKDCIEKEEFVTLANMAKLVAEEGIREISLGYIAPRPLESTCNWCNYADICAHKSEYPRKLASVSMSDLLSENAKKQ